MKRRLEKLDINLYFSNHRNHPCNILFVSNHHSQADCLEMCTLQHPLHTSKNPCKHIYTCILLEELRLSCKQESRIHGSHNHSSLESIIKKRITRYVNKIAAFFIPHVYFCSMYSRQLETYVLSLILIHHRSRQEHI